ncbi:MAG: hypothetical protein FD164_185 [Nitrospirae bacterium]|nr:MAG: hypothetical protein FD164_185 [Nitrospirota bacterium]
MSLDAGQLVERIRSITESGLIFSLVGTLRLGACGESVAQWMLGSKKVRFEAVMVLDAQSLTVTYWEMLSEKTSGIAAGFFMGRCAQKGTSRSESGKGAMPSGESYQYDFGSYRDRVRECVLSSGWQFRPVLKKP